MCGRAKKTRQARNDTSVGVVSRSACVEGQRKHAEHETTPTLGVVSCSAYDALMRASFRVQRVLLVLFCGGCVWPVFVEKVDEEGFLVMLTVNEINKKLKERKITYRFVGLRTTAHPTLIVYLGQLWRCYHLR